MYGCKPKRCTSPLEKGDHPDIDTLKKFSLRKWKNALAYDRIGEMIASNILGYYWVDGKNNPDDFVSKHWSNSTDMALTETIIIYFRKHTRSVGQHGR
jgi:hypothetical protein